MFFLWNDWNEGHIAKHGIDPEDAEYVVRRATRPYPRRTSGVKWLVKGRTKAGRAIQVIYVLRPADEIDVTLLTASQMLALQEGEPAVFVIHARPVRAGEG